MTTDTSERGLERLICAALTGAPCDLAAESTASLKLSENSNLLKLAKVMGIHNGWVGG